MFPNLYRLLLVELLHITEQEAKDLNLGSAEFYRLYRNAAFWILEQRIGDPLRMEVITADDKEAAAVIALAMRMSKTVPWPWREALTATTPEEECPF